MQILVVGATGFIGRHVTARLLRDNHTVTLAVRDHKSAQRRFPGTSIKTIDMNRAIQPQDWHPLLTGIEAVINCAGILQSSLHQRADKIHVGAPKALFDACVQCGIHHVIHISAVSADNEAGTEYARTKKQADDYLRQLDLDWIILRPSLVYAQGSFGGTSALRGLAGFPCAIPLIGDGQQQFQPIHVDDLAETIIRCLHHPSLSRSVLDVVGPQILTLKQILAALRCWLDIPPVPFIRLPMPFVRLLALIGDITGTGPIRSTSIAQMDYGNVSDASRFRNRIGFQPQTFTECLQQSPSHVQDRWHARLFFLRPALTLALAVLWIGSGIAGLVNPPPETSSIIAAMGLSTALATPAAIGFCIMDLLIGIWILTGWRAITAGKVQIAIIMGYSIGLSALAPDLWINPYGALLKNIPILLTIAVWLALRSEK